MLKIIGDNGWLLQFAIMRKQYLFSEIIFEERRQLDFCYLFEYICAKENKNLKLECNSELDRKGIDDRVNEINFQIAKITQRKEARSASKKKSLVTIPYAVFNLEDFERKIKSPRIKDKVKQSYQNSLQAFKKYFIRLNNGFVVFNEDYLKAIIENISNIEKVKRGVEKISRELAGES